MADRAASVREIILAGAAGGLVFWCLSVMRGGLPAGELAPFPVEQWRWISLVLAAFLGAAAAFVSIYWLANSDVNRRHQCLGFALVCGVMWEPVLTGAGQRLTKGFEDPKAAEAVKEAQQVTTTTEAGTPPPPEKTAEVAATLAHSVPNIQNPELKAQATESAERLLATLAKQASDQPKATEGIESVGVAAAQSDATKLIAKTIAHLDQIASTSPTQERQAKEAILKIRAIAAEKR